MSGEINTTGRYHVNDDVRPLTRNDRRRLVAIEVDLAPCYEHLETCGGCVYHYDVLDFIDRYEQWQQATLRRYSHYERASAVMVRALRQALGLSKAELARAIGAQGRSITGYEIGTQIPSATRMRRLVEMRYAA